MGAYVFQTNGGPWSIIYFPHYHPDTFSLMVLGQSIRALVIAVTVLRMFDWSSLTVLVHRYC